LTPFHAIILIDTQDVRHRFGETNRSRLVFLLTNFSKQAVGSFEGFVFYPFGLEVTPISPYLVKTGAAANREELDKLISSMNDPKDPRYVKDGDVVFFWSETEGGLNPMTGERTILLREKASSKTLTPYDREALKRQLEFRRDPKDPKTSRRTRLLVFVTDACSTSLDGTIPTKSPTGPGIWKSLYFGHKGTVDLASSRVGLPAYADVNGKSFFAEAFSRTFDGIFKEFIDTNRDCFVDWSAEYVDKLNIKLEEVYQDYLKTAPKSALTTELEKRLANGDFKLDPLPRGSVAPDPRKPRK
jgi:hypothetical protein